MPDRYLKHVPSGQIFIWQGVFAAQPDFVEVADVTGTPMPVVEAVAPPVADVVEVISEKRAKVVKAKIAKGKPAAVAEAEAAVENDAQLDQELLDLDLDADLALSSDASRGV